MASPVPDLVRDTIPTSNSSIVTMLLSILTQFTFLAVGQSFPTIPSLSPYLLQQDFLASTPSFFDFFRFYNDVDPTNGIVNYVDRSTASSAGLIKTLNGQTYIGVDNTTSLSTTESRNSVRIESLSTFTHGLFVLDLAHMPGGVCGSWPAWWLFGDTATAPGPSDPAGEIDIIENVNSADFDSSTLYAYKDGTCKVSAGESYGVFANGEGEAECHGSANGDGGCESDESRTNSFGTKFNEEGGGVYALQWTSDAIKVFFLPRHEIPDGVDGPLGKLPDPSKWGKPSAVFSGSCELDEYFRKMYMIFNVTFCGDNAGGKIWDKDSTCKAEAQTCEEFVRNNPEAFTEAYWLINSMRVYQRLEM